MLKISINYGLAPSKLWIFFQSQNSDLFWPQNGIGWVYWAQNSHAKLNVPSNGLETLKNSKIMFFRNKFWYPPLQRKWPKQNFDKIKLKLWNRNLTIFSTFWKMSNEMWPSWIHIRKNSKIRSKNISNNFSKNFMARNFFIYYLYCSTACMKLERTVGKIV